jgi:hypothetical protein
LPLAAALQMVNDLVNAADDHAGARPTPLLHELYRSSGVDTESTPAAVRLALLAGEAIERHCHEATSCIDRARRSVEGLGRHRLAAEVARCARFVSRVPVLLSASLLPVAS